MQHCNLIIVLLNIICCHCFCIDSHGLLLCLVEFHHGQMPLSSIGPHEDPAFVSMPLHWLTTLFSIVSHGYINAFYSCLSRQALITNWSVFNILVADNIHICKFLLLERKKKIGILVTRGKISLLQNQSNFNECVFRGMKKWRWENQNFLLILQCSFRRVLKWKAVSVS